MRILSLTAPALLIAVLLALAGGGSARAEQPTTLWLPWEGGGLWTYTQGPHGDELEALDFQPPDAGGQPCEGFLSSFWVTAATDGTVSLRPNGIEIDHGDGFGTGYYHMGNVQVAEGQHVVAGERLGNPGCCPDGAVEGCWATGPHLHFYTLYNGVRQPIAGINLGGWLVGEDGCLTRAEETVCADSRIISNTPDPVGASGPADIVVLLDTSQAELAASDADVSDAALAILQAAKDDDRISVIDFNSRVRTRAPLQTVSVGGALEPALAEAVLTEKEDSTANLRLGLAAACRELIVRGESKSRAVILISSGQDTTDNADGAEACLSRHGVPVFTYRTGEEPAPLLARVSEATGGTYRPLSEVRNLYCEFRLVRAVISGDPPGRCSALRIEPGDVLSLPFTIPADQDAATLEIRWRQRDLPGDEAEDGLTMNPTILAPSHTVLPTPYPGIEFTEDAGSATFRIARPVAGTWSLTVSSENVPEGGVYVTFSGSTTPQAPPEPEATEEPSAGPTDPPTDTPEPTATQSPDGSPTPEPTRPEPTAEPQPTPEPTRPVQTTPTPTPQATRSSGR